MKSVNLLTLKKNAKNLNLKHDIDSNTILI